MAEAYKFQGFDQCAILLNMEFERVFYKNNFAAGVELLNIYMICTTNPGTMLLHINTDFAKTEVRTGAT